MSVRSLPRRWRAVNEGSGGEFLRDRVYHPLGNEIWNDEFDDISIDPGWTRTDYSSSSYVTWKEGGNPGVGNLSAHHTIAASTSGSWHALSYALPAGATYPLVWETYVHGIARWDTNYVMMGVAFTDGLGTSGTNQSTAFGYMSVDTEGALNTQMRDYDNWSTGVTTWSMGIWDTFSRGYYLRIRYTAANTFQMGISLDAVQWKYGSSNTCTLTPTHASLIHTNWGVANQYVVSFQYARLYDTLDPESDYITTVP